MFCLSLHPVGLPVNVTAGSTDQDSLPDHTPHLERTDYHQTECEPCEPVLYLEVLASLLARLIAAWGGWLWGTGRLAWGGMVIALGVLLFLSFSSGFLFDGPLFWRPLEHILTGRNPYYCQWAKQTEYRQTFQHDGGNVSQIPVRDTVESVGEQAYGFQMRTLPPAAPICLNGPLSAILRCCVLAGWTLWSGPFIGWASLKRETAGREYL
jgi:hypothetical protein